MDSEEYKEMKECLKTLLEFVDHNELNMKLIIEEDMKDPREIARKLLGEKAKKKIDLIVESCGDCPYCQHYDDSFTLIGWYCDKRIRLAVPTSECFITDDNPLIKEDFVPEWCPLENV